jgi:hypothetical protein
MPCKRLIKKEDKYCCFHIKEGFSNKNNNISNLNISNLLEKSKKSIILKENKNKTLDFSKYRNMNCIEYLNLEVSNMSFIVKNQSETYKTYKNNLFNFTIKNNYYYIDNNNRNNGNGLLNLIMYIHNINIHEAVDFIEKYMKKNNVLFSFSLSSNVKNNISNEFENINNKNKLNSLELQKEYKKIPKRDEKNISKIKDYLKYKRKIHKGLVNSIVNEGRIYADSKNNCIFTNKGNTFAVIRSINSNYKSCSGTPDFITFKNTIRDNNINMYIFESVIDILSFITLYPNIKGSYISVNGNMMINKIHLIEDIGKCNILHLCFDNDKTGEEFCNIVIDSNIKEKDMIVRIKPKYKDFNEDLMNLKL